LNGDAKWQRLITDERPVLRSRLGDEIAAQLKASLAAFPKFGTAISNNPVKSWARRSSGRLTISCRRHQGIRPWRIRSFSKIRRTLRCNWNGCVPTAFLVGAGDAGLPRRGAAI